MPVWETSRAGNYLQQWDSILIDLEIRHNAYMRNYSLQTSRTIQDGW